MSTFTTIDITNLIFAFHATSDDASHAADERDHYMATCAEDLTDLSGPVLVALYNATVAELDDNITPVNKFANKETGAKRLWTNLEDLREVYVKRQAEAVAKAKAGKAPATTNRRGTGINLSPQSAAYPCRAGTKQARIIDLLFRPQGVTFDELHAAMSGSDFSHLKPWATVTTKSSLNWDVNKVKGYGVRTTKRGDADCYHLVLPAGMSAPHPHTPRKG